MTFVNISADGIVLPTTSSSKKRPLQVPKYKIKITYKLQSILSVKKELGAIGNTVFNLVSKGKSKVRY